MPFGVKMDTKFPARMVAVRTMVPSTLASGAENQSALNTMMSLENRGIDSGLVLCIPCGDAYDAEHYIAYTDDGDFAIGPTFATLIEG